MELRRVHDHPYAELDGRPGTERVANITHIAESTIGEFVEVLGSEQPAPGGGVGSGSGTGAGRGDGADGVRILHWQNEVCGG